MPHECVHEEQIRGISRKTSELEANANSVLLFELGKAIDGGYEVSDKFKDFMNDLNKSIENEKKKLERFGLND